MSRRIRARTLLAVLSAIEPSPVPPMPEEYDDEHHEFCNVNMFQGGRCDCDEAARAALDPEPDGGDDE